MNDREFIELLNLYIDREIAAEDAQRLEAEVASSRKRREIYDQYCRMQKACSMLSEEFVDSAARQTSPSVVAFPAQRRWAFGPLMASMASVAACAVAVVVFRNHGDERVSASPVAAAKTSHVLSLADSWEPAPAPVSMKPVFLVRMAPEDGSRVAGHPLFAATEAPSRMVQLNWIGDIHMAPVFPAASSDFLLNPKTDLKAAVMVETPDSREDQAPSEMAAFRFQR